ncbi:MAG: hypothetical protein DMF69_18685, partial [Acidobacteria bacterium]
MAYPRYRTSTATEWQRQTIMRSVLGLIVLGGLAIASLALPHVMEAAPDRARSTRGDRLERGGYRLRERAPAATSNTINATPVSPMFVSITVDRTDDTAAPLASLCTVAPNDCSLRGAVSVANLLPATTIIVPAGTYTLNINGTGEGFSGNNSVGDLDITGNNTVISGAGAGTTVIQQTQPNDRVIEVNPNLDASFNTTISNVTISGGRETTGVGGGGIISGAINNSLT